MEHGHCVVDWYYYRTSLHCNHYGLSWRRVHSHSCEFLVYAVLLVGSVLYVWLVHSVQEAHQEMR